MDFCSMCTADLQGDGELGSPEDWTTQGWVKGPQQGQRRR